jgi:hypothetical protein
VAERGGKSNLIPGRVSRNKRTLEGEDYARDILVQDDDDLLEVRDDETGKTHTLDRHERASRDPVYRALRAQARIGVGSLPGQLPPAVFASLADRAFGKVLDKLKVSGGRPLAAETDEELRDRLKSLESALGPEKAEVA